MSATVDAVLQTAVDRGDVPNVVALAADSDGPIYEGAAGPRAVGSDGPVTPDTMLRVASMTKMVTTVAALQLVERGELDLDAPVESYLPSFGELQVLDGFDGDTPRLRAPAGQARVEQLMTHTSGLGYWFFNADLVRYEQLTGVPNALVGSRAMFAAPLVADPGTRLEYGISTDWLGLVIEAASGTSLDKYFTAHIFEPLGMTRTAFLLEAEQLAGAVPVHVRGPDGSWTATDLDWSQTPEFWSGGGGLYSTPREYLAFQQMLLRRGELDGERLLEESTVEAAFTNQIGELDFPPEIKTADPAVTADFVAGPGWKFGRGLLLNTEQQPGMRAAGSGSWAGVFNTHYWIDPTSRITGAIYTQSLPFVEPRAFQMYVDFEKALYASL